MPSTVLGLPPPSWRPTTVPAIVGVHPPVGTNRVHRPIPQPPANRPDSKWRLPGADRYTTLSRPHPARAGGRPPDATPGPGQGPARRCPLSRRRRRQRASAPDSRERAFNCEGASWAGRRCLRRSHSPWPALPRARRPSTAARTAASASANTAINPSQRDLTTLPPCRSTSSARIES